MGKSLRDALRLVAAGLGAALLLTAVATPAGAEEVPVSGSFVAEGTLTGDIAGYVMVGQTNPEGLFPAQMTWTVTGGTGRFDRATGSLHLDTLFQSVPVTNRRITGTVSGSISIPHPTPTSKDDCKHGGWQNFADENGEPFRNKGQCVAWVNHHT